MAHPKLSKTLNAGIPNTYCTYWIYALNSATQEGQHGNGWRWYKRKSLIQHHQFHLNASPCWLFLSSLAAERRSMNARWLSSAKISPGVSLKFISASPKPLTKSPFMLLRSLAGYMNYKENFRGARQKCMPLLSGSVAFCAWFLSTRRSISCSQSIRA